MKETLRLYRAAPDARLGALVCRGSFGTGRAGAVNLFHIARKTIIIEEKRGRAA